MSDPGRPRLTAPRATLARCASRTGLGIASGREVTASLLPGDGGLRFRRTDTGGEVVATPEAMATGPSWSALGAGDASVQIVEHLLAALAAFGVTDVDVEVDGPDLPFGDGSATGWANLLTSAGREELGGEVECVTVGEPVLLRSDDGAQWLAAYPWPAAGPQERWRLVYALDWEHAMVDLQTARLEVLGEDAAPVLRARTFALAREAEAARQAGVFRAGDESNVVVIHDDRVSDPAALPDGFARHKILDLLGDLYAAGRPWRGLFIGYNSGHYLNRRMVQTLAARG